MQPTHAVLTFAALASMTLLLACDPNDAVEQADLVPERAQGSVGPTGFCVRNNDGLTVTVRNQSNIDVFQVTQTRVTFSTGDTLLMDTPPMPGGSFSEAGPFPIPAGCFNADCGFEIEVDAESEVPNEHDHNNTEAGRCIG